MIYRERTSTAPSAWISTRDYSRGGEAVCGLRYVYRGFTGCPAWAAGAPCSYCYLGTTFRADPELRRGVAWGRLLGDCHGCEAPTDGDECHQVACPSALDIAPARMAVRRWLVASDCEVPVQVLNAGELADSFGFPPEENPHIGMLLDLFSSAETNPHGHKILFLTKVGLEDVGRHLLRRQPSPNVILSWSLGNYGDEPGMPAEPERLEALTVMADRGWRVRVRLDPLGGSAMDQERYVSRGWNGHRIELVTLGSLRHRGGRQRWLPEEGASLYREALYGLGFGAYHGPIGLCKESPDMIRQVLGIEPEQMRCNCLP